MKLTDDKLAASDLTPEDLRLLEQISREVFGDERPALLSKGGDRIDLPEPVFQLFARMINALNEGDSIAIVPEQESMTTQAAADHLGVSRPFLVKLLEAGEIPFHNVGTHRRVLLKDVRAYEQTRDLERRARMKSLFDKIQEEGLYDAAAPNDED